jgi:hypothetical protein
MSCVYVCMHSAWGSVGFAGRARESLWRDILGFQDPAVEREAESYYQRLIDTHTHTITHTVNMKNTLKQIGKDLNRTFDALNSKQGPEGQQTSPRPREELEAKMKSLGAVLTAYAYHNPRVGYCQGMNFLAAVVLSVLPEEYAAFAMLSHLLAPKSAVYCDSMCGCVVDLAVIDTFIRFHKPELYKRVCRQLHCSMYALLSNWFLCFFVNAPLPVHRALRLWDIILLHRAGDPFILHRLTVGMVCLADGQFQGVESPAEVHARLKQHLCVDTKLPDLLDQLRALVNEQTLGDSAQLRAVRDMHKQAYVERQLRAGLGGFRLHALESAAWNAFSEQELNQVWRYFLEPGVWAVCANGYRVRDPAHFHAVLKKCLRMQQTLSASAVLCGVTDRLYRLFCEGETYLSFAQFLKGLHRLVKSNRAERLQLAFQLCHQDHGSGINKAGLMEMLVMFDEYYNGRRSAEAVRKETSLFVEFAFEKYAVVLTHSRRRRMSVPGPEWGGSVGDSEQETKSPPFSTGHHKWAPVSRVYMQCGVYVCMMWCDVLPYNYLCVCVRLATVRQAAVQPAPLLPFPGQPAPLLRAVRLHRPPAPADFALLLLGRDQPDRSPARRAPAASSDPAQQELSTDFTIHYSLLY